MSKPDQYVGFCRIPLSQELQETLRATEESTVTVDQMTKLNFKGADLRELPWEGTPKKAAGLKVIQGQDWPGKKNMRINWIGRDLVLFKYAVITDENERGLYVPRPFSPEADVKAIIHNTRTNASQIFSWDESHAFLLEEGVRVIAMTIPIRFFLLRFYFTTEVNGQEEHEQD
ncbi:hypothetical protein EDB81DRAFT_293620 [Dactylonectria macrodidyma]|uniref:Uncharacterized protein n=1 Tax=Dactylonectria macrodidyma TaxID=307937 RepID=A0A9P9IBS9_9HYPO|nr:hypothetical protein EDB81DRAFT_293620 [Dactylonectria macrodidyma]